ncbi:biopolymer transporter ExbD [Myxococcaceae bacterium GXIMD 01537]
MGMSVGGPNGGPKSDINVTPLVDVVLVLLIIFMVITPMLQRGKSVELPKAKEIEKAKPDAKDDSIILSVTPDKKIYMETDQLDEKALEDKLRLEIAKDPSRKILLKGDNSLQVADVRKVMDIARKASAKSIALGVEELKD